MPPKLNLPTIAHLKDHFLPQSETFIYTLITNVTRYHSIVLDRFQQQNQDIFPFTHHFSPALRFGKAGSFFERLALRSLNLSPYLEGTLRKQNTSLIHAHFGQLGALFYPIAKRRRIPLVTSFYGKDISVFLQSNQWQQKFRNLWQFGEIFCVLGPNMAALLAKNGCPENKIVILPLAVDVEKFSFKPHLKPEDEKPVKLLTVGRLIPKKGIDILLKALSVCAETTHLVVAGDGPERAKLETTANQLGLSHRVSFKGWITNDKVAELMTETDIFVLASHNDPTTGEEEGTPTVLLEAQARGMPVITTFHADIPTVVNNLSGRFLATENNSQALAQSIQSFIHLPAEKWLEVSYAARNFVEQTHNSQEVSARLELIYDSLVKQPLQGKQV